MDVQISGPIKLFEDGAVLDSVQKPLEELRVGRQEFHIRPGVHGAQDVVNTFPVPGGDVFRAKSGAEGVRNRCLAVHGIL